MTRYVALLLGVNLGRRMRMDMRALRDLLTGLGPHVATHLQSGNATFTSDCVEIAVTGTVIAVRDSRDPHGPQLAFTLDRWKAFTAAVKAERC